MKKEVKIKIFKKTNNSKCAYVYIA
jgi:hypothetical protein